MILIVTGSREADEKTAQEIIMATITSLGGVDAIWHGKCPTGADKAADKVGVMAHGINVRPFAADWTKFGRKAGHIRNGVMVGEAARIRIKGNDFLVLAIFAKGAENKGTGNCVEQAIACGFPIDIRWVPKEMK